MGRGFSRILLPMTLIRMLTHMTSGRYDGREWPLYQQEFDVPEWEADYLVKGGTAELADAPVLDRGFDVLKVADPDYESGLKFADGGIIENDTGEYGDSVPLLFNADGHRDPHATGPIEDDDFDSDFDDSDDYNEVEDVTPQVKRPSTVDSKAAWVEWAVAHNADKERAAAKTKAMLISEYGKL